MSQSIKIYVSCHKESYVPRHPLLYPIQVGTDLNTKRFEGMLHDNGGDSISSKNKSYCELTAQYWVWKNELADYYGFFHYRRYLSFNLIKTRVPYKIYKAPTQEVLDQLSFTADSMEELIDSHDIIAPCAEEMWVSVYDHYKKEHSDTLEYLDSVLKIIAAEFPAFKAAADEYMASTKHYFGNMFIMNREFFNNYCSFLFYILDKLDEQMQVSKSNIKADRTNGYLGERLFGIYYTWLKRQPNLRYTELSKAHFQDLSGETNNFSQMKLINTVLPPGTRRRAWVKKMVK